MTQELATSYRDICWAFECYLARATFAKNTAMKRVQDRNHFTIHVQSIVNTVCINIRHLLKCEAYIMYVHIVHVCLVLTLQLIKINNEPLSNGNV